MEMVSSGWDEKRAGVGGLLGKACLLHGRLRLWKSQSCDWKRSKDQKVTAGWELETQFLIHSGLPQSNVLFSTGYGNSHLSSSSSAGRCTQLLTGAVQMQTHANKYSTEAKFKVEQHVYTHCSTGREQRCASPVLMHVTKWIPDKSSFTADWQNNGTVLVKRVTQMMCCEARAQNDLTGIWKIAQMSGGVGAGNKHNMKGAKC